MTKRRIVILTETGQEIELARVPSYLDMKEFLKDTPERVRVLREDLEGFHYTIMYVGENSLIRKLPRNEKATALYQANTQRAYAGSDNPFRDASEDWHKRMEELGAEVMPYLNEIPDFNPNDPHIAGPAIWFDGWLEHEADQALPGAPI